MKKYDSAAEISVSNFRRSTEGASMAVNHNMIQLCRSVVAEKKLTAVRFDQYLRGLPPDIVSGIIA
jgi:hypothetical protein